MATAQLTSVILAEIPVAESGQASGLQSTFRQLGSALGVALLGTLLLTALGSSTSTRLADAGVPVAQRDQLVRRGDELRRLGDPEPAGVHRRPRPRGMRRRRR